MKIYCINLKRSTDRRVKMEAELAKTSLPYEFIDAVDGRLLDAEEKRRVYSSWGTRLRVGLGLTPGELGCVLSHLEFFKRIIESEDGVGVVLEDDVSLSGDIPQAVEEAASQLKSTSEPMLVQFPGLERDLRVGAKGERFVAVKSSMGTYAYAINRAAAELLTKAFTPVKMPIDYYGYIIRHFGLRYFVYSRMVLSVDMAGESSVGSDRKNFTGIRLLLFRAWRCVGVALDRLLLKFESHK